MPIVHLSELTDLVSRIFERHGMSARNAAILALNCVQAERDGAKGHGLFRVHGYVNTLESGWVDGRARPSLHSDPGASVIRVDAHNGFAQPALECARERACDTVRRTGVCLIVIKDSHHFAALWPDVEPFADRGYIALAFVNSASRVVPWGGRTPVYGTNPMAMAIPRKHHEPLVFDQASSLVSFGDVRLAAQRSQAVQPGTGVDELGQATTDAQAIVSGGALLPFGGYKGSSVAMMVEVLAAALTGGRFSFEVDTSRYPGAETSRTGELVLLLDPRQTGAIDFTGRVEQLIAALHASGQSRLPGDRRYERRRTAREHGIPVDEELLHSLQRLAGDLMD